MKTVEDLKKLREKVKAEGVVRHDTGKQVIIGMGTCGIAAGARQVMAAVMDEVAKKNLTDVQIRQTGCIGMCEKEVLLDIVRPNEPRVTYGRVKPEDVPKILEEHLINGRIVGDLVVAKF
ncbi:MAG: (2Fe-2S) ferredoxin domain-containing protein [Sporomusaceae bacterium]|jgi:NADP-reducing hydrogenase subunit HndB|nr:(2Fe-2S) ferredoxin domain-containing protein [Sporomusaceae bacterium]